LTGSDELNHSVNGILFYTNNSYIVQVSSNEANFPHDENILGMMANSLSWRVKYRVNCGVGGC